MQKCVLSPSYILDMYYMINTLWLSIGKREKVAAIFKSSLPVQESRKRIYYRGRKNTVAQQIQVLESSTILYLLPL